VYFEYKEVDGHVLTSTETHFLLLFAYTGYLAVSDFLTFEP